MKSLTDKKRCVLYLAILYCLSTLLTASAIAETYRFKLVCGDTTDDKEVNKQHMKSFQPQPGQLPYLMSEKYWQDNAITESKSLADDYTITITELTPDNCFGNSGYSASCDDLVFIYRSDEKQLFQNQQRVIF